MEVNFSVCSPEMLGDHKDALARVISMSRISCVQDDTVLSLKLAIARQQGWAAGVASEIGLYIIGFHRTELKDLAPFNAHMPAIEAGATMLAIPPPLTGKMQVPSEYERALEDLVLRFRSRSPPNPPPLIHPPLPPPLEEAATAMREVEAKAAVRLEEVESELAKVRLDVYYVKASNVELTDRLKERCDQVQALEAKIAQMKGELRTAEGEVKRMRNEQMERGVNSLQLSMAANHLNAQDSFPSADEISDTYKRTLMSRDRADLRDLIQLVHPSSSLIEIEALLACCIEGCWRRANEFVEGLYASLGASATAPFGSSGKAAIDFTALHQAQAAFYRQHFASLKLPTAAKEEFTPPKAEKNLTLQTVDKERKLPNRHSLVEGVRADEGKGEKELLERLCADRVKVDEAKLGEATRLLMDFADKVTRLCVQMYLSVPKLVLGDCDVGQLYNPKHHDLHYSCAALSKPQSATEPREPPLRITQCCYPPIDTANKKHRYVKPLVIVVRA